MSRIIVAPLLLVLGISPVGAQNVPAPFKADRSFLFQQCAVLHNYEMDAKNTTAVQKGRTVLTDGMKTAIGMLLNVWEQRGDSDERRLAFILATARRESQSTFTAIREAPRCRDDEACRERVIGAMLARRAELKKRPPRPNYALPDSNGHRYYGRGFIQLTFKENYADAGDKLGIDLVNNPDKVLDPRIAAEILVRAMLEGWYGSRRPLSFYIGGSKEDWINARNNVNPNSPNKPVTKAYATDLVECLRSAQ